MALKLSKVALFGKKINKQRNKKVLPIVVRLHTLKKGGCYTQGLIAFKDKIIQFYLRRFPLMLLLFLLTQVLS